MEMSTETLIWQKEAVSEQETALLAEELVRDQLSPGDILALHGDLGSGKTFFCKAVCRALATNEASSPTFTIVNVYQNSSGLSVYHFDFYRIEHRAELQNLGLDDYFYDDGICLIEWPEKLGDLLPPSRYDLYLEPLPNNPGGRSLRLIQRK
ncbi:MAG: tRNA (adenosine(37)-N6)-threonylcarbamoyltransferase complex ATPase subunit type 1 TsaE [Calditrichia bacterium]